MCEPAVFESTETCSEMTKFRQHQDTGLIILTLPSPTEESEYYLYINTSDSVLEEVVSSRKKMIQVDPQTFKSETETGLGHTDPYVFAIGLEDYQPGVDEPIVSWTMETEPFANAAEYGSFPQAPSWDTLVREEASLTSTTYAFETEIKQVMDYDVEMGNYPWNMYTTWTDSSSNIFGLDQRAGTHERLLVGDKIRVVAFFYMVLTAANLEGNPMQIPQFWSWSHERLN